MKALTLGTTILAGALVFAPAGWGAYQAGDVKDGGSISGSVKFKGTPPAPKKLEVSKDQEVCGKTPKTDQSLIVANGNLVNAVVTITRLR